MWKEWLERTLGPVPSATMAAAADLACLKKMPLPAVDDRDEIGMPADMIDRFEPAAAPTHSETPALNPCPEAAIG
jgi:hypothetical protein